MRMALLRSSQPLIFRLRHFVRESFCRVALVTVLSVSLALVARAAPQPENGKALQIYFVDVEGGQATLFVTPGGKSLLIDTGWPDNNGRDAERIVAAAKMAGLKQLDFVLLTHYHMDHAGGITQLAAQIPIRTVIDHGENRETKDAATERVWQDYQALLAKVKLRGGGGKNASCDSFGQYPADQSENGRSLGVLFTFGKLRILDLGDLTSDKERELVCPVNKLGMMDIFIVSHHGSNQSNSPELLNAIAPRVAIMDNGAAKGGSPSSWDIIKKSPKLQDFWQLHFSDEGGAAHNATDPFIANTAGLDAGNYLKLTAWADGNFEVFNSRTSQTKHYAAAR